jgi:cellulose synthase/poly-beta-1,6-N-acetylglucosamine synthase-like glycosyltransferase
MVFITYILLCTLAGILAVPTIMLAIECITACLAGRGKPDQPCPKRPRCVVLVPAHNEENVIGGTLDALKNRVCSDDRILVIADNCNDATAALARNAGVEVIERHDLTRRGKGYAMQFGVDALRSNPPEVILFLDADCKLGEGALDRLVTQAHNTGCVAQANYQMRQERRPTEHSNTKAAISEFAVLIKNSVRPHGMTNLGIPCHLTGSGMAFPWSIAEPLCFATNNIVEDMAIGCEVVLRQRGPIFCERSEVFSPLPVGDSASLEQRRRWEHGHLNTLIHQMPRMFLAALHQRRLDLFGFALDMTIPPLTLLTMALLGTWVAAAIFSVISIVPLLVLTFELAVIALSLTWAAITFSNDASLRPALWTIPKYAASKVSLYLAFAFTGSQQQWVRTSRKTLDASDA